MRAFVKMFTTMSHEKSIDTVSSIAGYNRFWGSWVLCEMRHDMVHYDTDWFK